MERFFRRRASEKPKGKRKRNEPLSIPAPEKPKGLPQERILSTTYHSAHYDEYAPKWGPKEESATGKGCVAKAQFIELPDKSKLCRVMYRIKGLTEEKMDNIREQIRQNMENLECDFEVHFVETDDIMNESFPISAPSR